VVFDFGFELLRLFLSLKCRVIVISRKYCLDGDIVRVGLLLFVFIVWFIVRLDSSIKGSLIVDSVGRYERVLRGKWF
jgi:uncharacterized membrane protein